VVIIDPIKNKTMIEDIGLKPKRSGFLRGKIFLQGEGKRLRRKSQNGGGDIRSGLVFSKKKVRGGEKLLEHLAKQPVQTTKKVK